MFISIQDLLRRARWAAFGAALVAASHPGCARPPAAAGDGRTQPVYDQSTGRLAEIVSDRNADGRIDTRAFMQGVEISRIEIDRDSDGHPDRWEYYAARPQGTTATGTVAPPQIERAEESTDRSGRIARREFYEQGQLQRVEEDTDGDGRVDKWEQYGRGALQTVLLDLQGKGFPDRRFVYGPDGSVKQLDADPDGDGVFVPLPPTPPVVKASRTPISGGRE